MANSPNSQVLFLNVVFSDVFGNLFLLGQKFTQILLIEKQSHFFLMERERRREQDEILCGVKKNISRA